MKCLLCGAGLLVLGVPMVLAVAGGAEPERTLSIRAIMHKQYTVTRAPFVLIKKELDSGTPDWEKVQELAGNFVNLAAGLEKNEPKWGDMESWKRFTDLHMG